MDNTSEINYEEIKFKSGLEIHQQLETRRKLFCFCPPLLRKNEPDLEIKRKLHTVPGEFGEVDIAAKYQANLDKEFIYQGYLNSNCLVEYDESPPELIDDEAIEISLHIAFLLNMKVIPISQIMRKVVVDGSNTSGFQRTVLIARDGKIETSQGKVGISYLYLEEDAARIVERGENVDVYRLDRLGIPMVEIVTAPDIKNSEHAKEVALYIGEILRRCRVKRGIGTIRQDVNVSVKGENRVEIKGMQDMKIFVKVIENEIERQISLSNSGNPVEMEVRAAQKDGTTKYLRPLPGAARMYPETDLPLLKIPKNIIDKAKKTLPDLKKNLRKELGKQGLNDEMISQLIKLNKLDVFRGLSNILKKPKTIAKLLIVYPKEIASKEKISLNEIEEILNRDVLENVVEEIKKGKISEGNLKDVLLKIVKKGNYKDAIKSEKKNVNLIEEEIMKIVREKPGLSLNAYMGLIMKEFGGSISGKEIMEIIKKYVG